jgi:hypothetical protein
MGRASAYRWDLFDWAAFVYFALHVPTTLLIDAQAIAPPGSHPQFAVDALAWHVSAHKDVLMGTMPAWFRGVVWAECVLQLPFFLVALYAWLTLGNYIRIPTIMYGAHTATTLVPSESRRA